MNRSFLVFAVPALALHLACSGGDAPPAAAPAEGKSAAPAAGAPSRAAETKRAAESTPAPTPRPTPPPVVVPDGTDLVLSLDSALSSDQSRPEDVVEATLAEAVRVGERVVVPEGSIVKGHVLVAQRSGKVKGLARLAVAFDRLVVGGKTYDIEVSPIDVTAEKTKGRDAKILGGAAAAGAIIGGIAGGGKGALKGGVVGGAAGGGAVLLTRGKEVELPARSKHTVRLTRSFSLD